MYDGGSIYVCVYVNVCKCKCIVFVGMMGVGYNMYVCNEGIDMCLYEYNL